MEDLSVQHHFMKRYVLATLIAIELLMSFSFLGYFHVEPISLTIAYLPVLLAAGTAAGAVIGLLGGLLIRRLPRRF